MGAFARFAGPSGRQNHGGDPLADAAIDRVLDAPGTQPGNFVEAVQALAADGDSACAALIEHMTSTPAWVDPALIELGCEVTLAKSAPIGAVLAAGSLPEVYAVPAIARVLTASGRLKTKTWLRIVETGRFLRDVHGHDASQGLGQAARAVAQVRLVHAMVRRKVTERGGPPCITQQQMSFVVCAHSHVMRRGLASLGLPLTDRQARAHQHLWRLIGHRMGIEADGLATSPEEEARLYARLWLRMVDGTDAACRELTDVAVRTTAAKARLPQGLAQAIARRLVRPTLATRLQLGRRNGWDRALQLGIPIVRAVHDVGRALPGATRAALWLGRVVADAVVAQDPSRGEPVGVAAGRDALAEDSR